MEDLIIYETPELNEPYMVIGFSGWANAADVSIGVVSYLVNKLRMRKFAEIRADDFYDFTSERPLVIVEKGVVKEMKFPSNIFFYWKNDLSNHDLITFLGVEPNLSWDKYANLIFDVAEKMEVKRIYTVGGTLDRVPHTREPIITALISDPELKKGLGELNIEPTDYQGPMSIHSLLLLMSKKRNIKSASIWGHAPHYIQNRNAKVCYGVLRKLTRLIKVDLDLGDLRNASEYLEEQVDKLVNQKPELYAYVKKLEEEYESQGKHEEPLPGGEELVKEIEDFFKEEHKNDTGE